MFNIYKMDCKNLCVWAYYFGRIIFTKGKSADLKSKHEGMENIDAPTETPSETPTTGALPTDPDSYVGRL